MKSKTLKREEAEERAEVFAKLSVKEWHARIVARRGESKKELARLKK